MINKPLNKTEIGNVIKNLTSYFKSQKKWVLIAEHLRGINADHELDDDLTTYDEIMILVFWYRKTNLINSLIIPSSKLPGLTMIKLTDTLQMTYSTIRNTVKFISTDEDDPVTVSIYAR